MKYEERKRDTEERKNQFKGKESGREGQERLRNKGKETFKLIPLKE